MLMLLDNVVELPIFRGPEYQDNVPSDMNNISYMFVSDKRGYW